MCTQTLRTEMYAESEVHLESEDRDVYSESEDRDVRRVSGQRGREAMYI
jgi:hypothetical protein